MVALPPLLAYWVRPPEPIFSQRLPSDWDPTLTLGMVMDDPTGLESWALAPKVKLVPTLIHAACVPVAFGLAW